MPQNIAQKYQQAVRAKQRAQPFTEAEDLQLFNTLLKLNEKEDPSIEESRGLTVEDKRWKHKKADIDIASSPFANYLLDNDSNIREDLNIKDITNLRNSLPELMESLRTNYNPDKDPRTSNYINSLGVKFAMALSASDRVAFTKDSVAEITRKLESLGDDERMEGKWNLPDTQFLMHNIKNAHNQSLEKAGSELKSEYLPSIEYLNDKRHVFEALDSFTSNPQMINDIKGSERATASLNEAIRLMKTTGDEDITRVKELMDEVSKFVGEDKKAGRVANKERAELTLDEQELEGQTLSQNMRSYYESELDSNIQDKIGWKFTAIPAKSFKFEKSRKNVHRDNTNKMKSLLKGVGDFNEHITWDNKDYASNLDIKKEVNKKTPNMNAVVRYFTDRRPVETDAGQKTLGYMRIHAIDTGNEDENLHFRHLLEEVIEMDAFLRRVDKISLEDMETDISSRIKRRADRESYWRKQFGEKDAPE